MNFVFLTTKVEIFRPLSGVYPDFRKFATRLAGEWLWTTHSTD